MPTDVIIGAFSVPPQKKYRQIAVEQPLTEFRDRPLVIDVNGIGSDVFMGPTDTARAPREPWGGKPFAREAAMYRQSDGSVLKGLLQRRARGIDIGRIGLVGFSAGGTFVGEVLKSDVDYRNVDFVLLLDALMVSKSNGAFVPQSLGPWARYAANALMAGVRARTGNDSRDPFLGPVFITSHTSIKQSAKLELMVGNTTDSSQAVFDAAIEAMYQLPEYQQTGGSTHYISTDMAKLVTAPGPFPLTIGSPQGVPPPNKTWTSMPQPNPIQAWGNFYNFGYGGTVGADHVFQDWYVQPAMLRTFLIPRWNAENASPYAVAGLSGFLPCCPGPGGNFVAPGTYPTGTSLLWTAAALAAGFYAGKTLLS